MTPSHSAACDCGSGTRYDTCCGRWHQGASRLGAPSAELLMRSRYCAFVRRDAAYLLDTWHPSTRPATLDPDPPGLRWLGLQVRAHRVLEGGRAEVEFVARSRWQGRGQRHHETSRFVFEQGRWWYVDGDVA